MAALLLLAFFLALSVLVLLRRGADTRDAEYSLGRVLAPRTASGAQNG
jgi:hypothetical protein